jgi:hypothetical protein
MSTGLGFDERLAELILTGDTFTADDVTYNGRFALDRSHSPNGKQSGIGSMFQQASREHLIEFTGQVTKSKAKHRKGGAIRIWRGTEKGARWAQMILEA